MYNTAIQNTQTFKYNQGSRVMSTLTTAGINPRTRIYNGDYETQLEAGVLQQLHYISTPTGLSIIVLKDNGGFSKWKSYYMVASKFQTSMARGRETGFHVYANGSVKWYDHYGFKDEDGNLVLPYKDPNPEGLLYSMHTHPHAKNGNSWHTGDRNDLTRFNDTRVYGDNNTVYNWDHSNSAKWPSGVPSYYKTNPLDVIDIHSSGWLQTFSIYNYYPQIP
jgi:hypothetical protein